MSRLAFVLRAALIVSLVGAGMTLAPSVARAEDTAKDHYEKGKTHYDLGRFEDAITEFQKAYELKADPAFLYNIAQAYRQMGDAAKAVFFYKRFLALKPDASNREDVEKRIAELEDIAKQQQEAKGKPPEQIAEPDKGDEDEDGKDGKDGKGKGKKKHGEVANADDEDEDDDSAVDEDPDAQVVGGVSGKPSKIRMEVAGGGAFVDLGGGPEVPVQASFRVDGGYILSRGNTAVDLGALFSFTPIPFQAVGGANGTANLIGLGAAVTGRYFVKPNVDLKAEAGLGVMWMGGLTQGNPFTDGALAASAPLPMFNLRFGVGADYYFGKFVVFATPFSLSYSPANEGLAAEISSIVKIDVLFGVGYSL